MVRSISFLPATGLARAVPGIVLVSSSRIAPIWRDGSFRRNRFRRMVLPILYPAEEVFNVSPAITAC